MMGDDGAAAAAAAATAAAATAAPFGVCGTIFPPRSGEEVWVTNIGDNVRMPFFCGQSKHFPGVRAVFNEFLYLTPALLSSV